MTPIAVVLGHARDGVRAADLLTSARRAAIHFVASGTRHVGYFGLNDDVLPVALFGAAMAGLPFVPLNYRGTDAQLANALSRIDPCLIIAGTDDQARLKACGSRELPHARFSSARADGNGRSMNAALPDVDADDVAVLLYTSGTTGEPKAAVLRHRHLTSYIFGAVDFLGCEPSEAQLVSVPPYHIAGISAVLSSLFSGRRIVYLPAFEPEAWVRAARDESVTHAMVVPTMLGRVLAALDGHNLGIPALLLTSPTAGAACRPRLVEAQPSQALPQVDFVNAYGLTETSSTIALLSPDDHRQALASSDPDVRARLSSVGRPLPSVEVEIRDPDEQPVPAGTTGEIWVSGEQVAGEYVGQAGPAGGWFRTKDAGHFDQDGFLFVEGRLDDVIVRGGENISPGEVEDVLVRHPAVAEVAVIGVPDPEWGEVIAAVVVVAPGQSLHGGGAPGVGAPASALVQDAVAGGLPARAALQLDRQAAPPRPARGRGDGHTFALGARARVGRRPQRRLALLDLHPTVNLQVAQVCHGLTHRGAAHETGDVLPGP